MDQSISTHFFLGSNSRHGFYSLNEQFAQNPPKILHSIKGGPGTGKSTFMRTIGKSAEEHGYAVEYILCSGDPDSIDGVYIPALETAWLDGTAPHVVEPVPFGIQGDYINLGEFCKHEALKQNAQDISLANQAYKQQYKLAYSYLSAAGTLKQMTVKSNIDKDTATRIEKRAQSKIEKELAGIPKTCNSKMFKRFLRAFCCKGNYVPPNTLECICNRLCVLESHYGLEQLFFDAILQKISVTDVCCIQCLNPLCPELTEAIILPEQKLCFITHEVETTFSGTKRTIHLDTYITPTDVTAHKQMEKQTQLLLDHAFIHLHQAKLLHDELESYYRPALNIDALNGFTEQYLAHLW